VSEETAHEDLEGLVPLLALDALTPPEELQLRAHVQSCSSCAVLLREHLETAADLALLAGPTAPPSELKARLMADIAQEPQIVPAGGTAADGPAASDAPQPSDELGARRAGRAGKGAGASRPWWQRIGVGVAAAACLLLGLAWFAYDSAVDNAAKQDAVLARQQEILDLINGRQPAMTLVATGKGPAAGGHVFVKGNKAAVVLSGLDRSAKGVYEVWAIRGNKPVPLKAVGEDAWQGAPGGAIVILDGGFDGANGMAVSIEPSEPPATAEGPKGPIVLST
jgi:putative zinc finger protein